MYGAITAVNEIQFAMISMNDIMPLEILLHAMRMYWRQGEVDKAIAIARAAAPYVHPRAGKGQDATHIELDIGHLSDAELARQLAAARARIESPSIDSSEFA